jgi:hypothetical protein
VVWFRSFLREFENVNIKVVGMSGLPRLAVNGELLLAVPTKFANALHPGTGIL